MSCGGHGSVSMKSKPYKKNGYVIHLLKITHINIDSMVVKSIWSIAKDNHYNFQWLYTVTKVAWSLNLFETFG